MPVTDLPDSFAAWIAAAGAPRDGQGTDNAPGWLTDGIATYQQHLAAAPSRLRDQLDVAVRHLTGRPVDPRSLYVDPARSLAQGRVDGLLFRLQDDTLHLMLSCAYCQVGLFQSDPLRTPIDVGRAVADWRPLHADCEPADTPE